MRITPQWIKGESGKLLKHMQSIDSYRMNHAAFRDYILLLLSDEHMSVLRGEPAMNEMIADDIMQSARNLRLTYVPAVVQRLILLADKDAALQEKIGAWQWQREKDARWHRTCHLWYWLWLLFLVFCSGL